MSIKTASKGNRPLLKRKLMIKWNKNHIYKKLLKNTKKKNYYCKENLFKKNPMLTSLKKIRLI
jgi:hypothetical protein